MEKISDTFHRQSIKEIEAYVKQHPDLDRKSRILLATIAGNILRQIKQIEEFNKFNNK